MRRAEFGTDRLVIGGGSAGGHLSVLTLLRLRDRHDALGAIAAANLVAGAFDLGMTPSQRTSEDALIIPLATLEACYRHFLPGLDREARRDPSISPLYADLTGMPPALFTTGTLDPVLDDSIFLAGRWRAAGSHAELAIYPEAVHGFAAFPTEMARRRPGAHGRVRERPARALSAARPACGCPTSSPTRGACASTNRVLLRGDLLAGVTVAAYLIPQCMAYAELAGLPPIVGLWAVLAPMTLYAIFGSSPQLSVGPESTTAVMTAAALLPLAVGDPAKYAALASALAILVGVICIIGFLLRLGFLADLLSRPILIGYMAGVAMIMIAGQLEKTTGVPVTGETFVDQVRSFFVNIGDVHGATLALGAAMLVFLFVGNHFFPKLPMPLIAVLLATAAVAVLGLESEGIKTVGEIPAGFPSLEWPNVSWGELSSLLGPALGIAVVGYSDVVLTGRSFAARHDDEIDANQELLALGITNASAGITQGFPVSSSASRTVIGDAVGGRSPLTGLAVVVSVVLVLLFLRPLLAEFPQAALGALVIYAAIRLIDVAEFRRLARFRKSELTLALATMAGVLLVDILYGVLIAVALSVLDLFRRVARPHDAVLGTVPGLPGLHDVNDYPEARTVPGLIIYRYDAPLCFANAENFRLRALASVDSAEIPVEWFVLNVEAIVEVDITAADALAELHRELIARDVTLGVARLKQDLRDELEPAGAIDAIGENMIFPTLPTVLEAFAHRHDDRS